MNTSEQIWEGVGMALAVWMCVSIVYAIYKIGQQSGRKIIAPGETPSRKQVLVRLAGKVVTYVFCAGGIALAVGGMLSESGRSSLTVWIALFLCMAGPALYGLYKS